jgi:hypothetical protein
MRNVVFAVALAAAGLLPDPSAAQQGKQELIALAEENGACSDGRVVDAYFREGSTTELIAECEEDGAAALLSGGMGNGGAIAIGALVLVAIAASGGGGGDTPATSGTD